MAVCLDYKHQLYWAKYQFAQNLGFLQCIFGKQFYKRKIQNVPFEYRERCAIRSRHTKLVIVEKKIKVYYINSTFKYTIA